MSRPLLLPLALLLLLSVTQLCDGATPVAHARRSASAPLRDAAGAGVPSLAVLTGAPNQLLAFRLTGDELLPTSNATMANTMLSWQAFKEPNFLYSVDEDSTHTRMFQFNVSTGEVSRQPLFTGKGGSSGVVHLEFNLDQTRMLGASYGSGTVDVWDTSSPSGDFYLLKQIRLEGPVGPVVDRGQGQHRAHSTALEPSGRFFIVNDLGGDSLHILSVDAAGGVSFQSRVQVSPVGCGPRHGAFLTLGGRRRTLREAGPALPAPATHYVVACEISSELLLFALSTSESSAQGGQAAALHLTQVQTVSSYGALFPPADPSTAAAGELVVSREQRHVYVSNRLSGNATDSVAHFAFERSDSAAGGAELRFVDTVSSLGLVPRGMALSADAQQTLLLVANQNGTQGLLAFQRDAHSGRLTPHPVAQVPNQQISPVQNNGPQSILSIVL